MGLHLITETFLTQRKLIPTLLSLGNTSLLTHVILSESIEWYFLPLIPISGSFSFSPIWKNLHCCHFTCLWASEWSCVEAGRNKTTGDTGHCMTGEEGGAGPISVRNNKRQRLGLEWSMSEVVTPPPHNSDKTHGLVASINNNMPVIGRFPQPHLFKKQSLWIPACLKLWITFYCCWAAHFITYIQSISLVITPEGVTKNSAMWWNNIVPSIMPYVV